MKWISLSIKRCCHNIYIIPLPFTPPQSFQSWRQTGHQESRDASCNSNANFELFCVLIILYIRTILKFMYMLLRRINIRPGKFVILTLSNTTEHNIPPILWHIDIVGSSRTSPITYVVLFILRNLIIGSARVVYSTGWSGTIIINERLPKFDGIIYTQTRFIITIA